MANLPSNCEDDLTSAHETSNKRIRKMGWFYDKELNLPKNVGYRSAAFQGFSILKVKQTR